MQAIGVNDHHNYEQFHQPTESYPEFDDLTSQEFRVKVIIESAFM